MALPNKYRTIARMDDIEQALRAAWDQVRPKLEQDPEKLRKRLARRQSRTMRKPPRAWCLAVRATDTRLDKETWKPKPQETNEVVLDSMMLRRLCAPVRIDPPGELLADVAKRLGVRPAVLDYARANGILKTRYMNSHTVRGKPTPLVYTAEALDPCGVMFQSASE